MGPRLVRTASPGLQVLRGRDNPLVAGSGLGLILANRRP
jgi:hypothetical protein